MPSQIYSWLVRHLKTDLQINSFYLFVFIIIINISPATCNLQPANYTAWGSAHIFDLATSWGICNNFKLQMFHKCLRSGGWKGLQLTQSQFTSSHSISLEFFFLKGTRQCTRTIEKTVQGILNSDLPSKGETCTKSFKIP